MKNATLVINNPEGFADDIWQYDDPADWDEKTWGESIESLTENAQMIYEYLYDTEIDDDDCPITDSEIYILGDLINMLRSIEVKTDDKKLRDEIIHQKFEGEEMCSKCGREIYFSIIPINGVEIVCPHCGEKQHPCSLCDSRLGGCSVGDCKDWVIQSLINYSKEEEDK